MCQLCPSLCTIQCGCHPARRTKPGKQVDLNCQTIEVSKQNRKHQPARSCAPSSFSSAATIRVEYSAICASVIVAALLCSVTRTISEYFPPGTFFPRNKSAASIEVISAI